MPGMNNAINQYQLDKWNLLTVIKKKYKSWKSTRCILFCNKGTAKPTALQSEIGQFQ